MYDVRSDNNLHLVLLLIFTLLEPIKEFGSPQHKFYFGFWNKIVSIHFQNLIMIVYHQCVLR